ncbi:MAG: extracellular solute-binding protein [Clostridia bacterium]|nr:extracellular solute-binding protein [Clostridia bacterium]
MKIKRIVTALMLLAVVFVSVFSFAGCRKQVVMPEFEMPEGGFDTNKKITITFYHTMNANLRDVLDFYIGEFQKLYPNVTVKHQQVGSYEDVRNQISTEINVGDQPNIAYCYPDHVALYNMASAVQPLDVLINSTLTEKRADGTTETIGLTDAQIADFIKGYYDEGKQFGDGKMYMMPFSKSTEVLYYNKTFFDQHNLTVPTTWDEMEAVCEQIKALVPNCTPLGYDSEANWFITMCEQSGSAYTSSGENHFKFDNATNRAFVARFREWYQKGYVTTQELSGGYTSKLFTKNEGEVGKVYMCIGSSAGATNQAPNKVNGKYAFEVGIATVPQLNPEKPKVISQGPSLCIFKKEDPQEVLASWLFVKYLTTCVEFQAEFSMTSGYVPVIKSVGDNPVYAEFLENADGGDYIAALSAKRCLEQEAAYYTSPAFYGSAVARDQVGLLMQKCLSAAWTSGETASQIKKAFENAVSECKYQTGS